MKRHVFSPSGEMPRVCQLVHSFNIGGAETLAARFARTLGGPQRVTLACLDEIGTLADHLADEGFSIHRLGRKPGFDVRCAWKLGRLLHKNRIELVHAHQYTPFFYAMMARKLVGGPPILFTEHGRFYPDLPSRKRKLVNPWLLRPTDHITAVGECVRTALVNNEGFTAGRIEVVYNGIDLGRFQGDHDAEADLRGAVRAELGLRDEQIAVMTVARLDPIKDHATSIRAMKRIAAVAPNIVLLLAGDGPLRGELETLTRELGLEERVRFLGMRRDVDRLLAGIDIFLLNSVSEGIPLTVIEAMASRVPVICTHVGGMPEVIEDRVSGLLVEAGNEGAVADAILRLGQDASIRRWLAGNGHERVTRQFDESTMLERYAGIYQQLTRPAVNVPSATPRVETAA